MKIENWAVVESIVNPYAAPEMRALSLQGQVFGHPRFNDGQYITTSSIDKKNDRDEVVTISGSSYELGRVDPSYEEKFPNARNKLLNSLKGE